jgi:PhnB protein
LTGFSLSIPLPDQAAEELVFNALAAGGQVRMPLTKTFFSPHFGMLSDRFGVGWMVIVMQ